MITNSIDNNHFILHGAYVGLNSVPLEILSSVTIVFYDNKVRGDICRFWPFVSMLQKTDIIWFSNLSTRAYLMKVIPETCHAH
jgi:hypothetical protein